MQETAWQAGAAADGKPTTRASTAGPSISFFLYQGTCEIGLPVSIFIYILFVYKSEELISCKSV